MRIPRTIALVPAIFPIWFATMVAGDDNENNNNNDDYAGNDTEPIEATSPKRGLCYVSGEDPEDDRTWDHSDSDLSWYYNFQAHPIRGMDDKLQYVPMLWGEDSVDDLDGSFFDVVKGHIDSGLDIEYVLGFNEPDGCEGGGSCIDPDKAAEVWIDQIEPLKDLGLNLGAPAVTGSPRGLRWLQDFYTECNGGCTTDFLPIHWYGNFEGMAAYIGQVNETYQNMSMWITEFNYPEQDLEETQAFFNQSINHLDELSFVTHYSWFGAFRSDESNVGPNGALLDSDGELTDMGSYYMGGSSTGKVPSSATVNAAFAGASVFVVAAVFWSFG